MWRTAPALLTLLVLATSPGCASSERPRRDAVFDVRLTSPEAFAGTREYASGNLRVRVTDARGWRSLNERAPVLLCVIEIENTRDAWARVDANHTCLVDPNRGAAPLLWKDAPIPPKCWTRLDFVAQGLININFNLGEAPRTEQEGGEQRVLLNVIWDDGVTESVDLSYKVDAQKARD